MALTVQSTTSRSWQQPDILVPLVVLILLVVFTGGLLFYTPYQGFYFNPSTGEVMDVYLPESSNPGLEVGDFIERVGSVTFEMYQQRVPFFSKNAQLREAVDIVVRRNGEQIVIPWVYPGFNRIEFQVRAFNVWWLAFVFWFTGMYAQLFMRPKNRRWGLFLAFNYLTALFIMFGSVSSFRLFGSATLLRVVAWLMLPVYLHFHWIFPQSLRPVPRWLRVAAYVLCGLMALGELFLPIPATLYFIAVILAFGGSILLLLLHYFFQREHRREVSMLAVSAFFSLGFTILTSIIGSSGSTPHTLIVSLLALPILPGTYFYILYRRSLGGMELRANRAISMYIFLTLLGIITLLAFRYLDLTREVTVFAALLTTLIAAFASIQVFPAFQSLVERRLLGIKLPGQGLSESYSARIITSDTLPDLLKLLREEVFPSLLIRQYACARNLKTSAQILLSENVTQDQVPEKALRDLFDSFPTGSLVPPSELGQPLEWVHLALPLRFGSELIGVWLLGRRDPDDRYPQAEIPILQGLANQTAVALSNILQAQWLKSMYRANIDRYELERTGLARDLHDGFLNEMAGMLMKHDPASLPPEFLESFDKLIVRLRDIVSQLRPPMLGYGLKFALDGLADNLLERTHDTVQVVSDIEVDGEWRYPEIVENNLYRIVQEACENALKSAHSKSIHITGQLCADSIDLQVSDDGIGFNTETSLKSDEMLANKHFGLAGMHERAELIGASLQIVSKPGQGTKVRVQWESA